jgi:hypothetical protein
LGESAVLTPSRRRTGEFRRRLLAEQPEQVRGPLQVAARGRLGHWRWLGVVAVGSAKSMLGPKRNSASRGALSLNPAAAFFY